MSELIYVPFVKISNNSIVTYSLPLTRPQRTDAQKETAKNLTRGVFTGQISQKAQREIVKRSQNWLLSIQEAKRDGIGKVGKDRRYTTFVTLTLSAKQEHSDNVIKRELLNTFIIYMKRKFEVQEYIWRAEAQQNGNIHFHLFVDKYIEYRELRHTWNTIQERLGYISRYEEKYGGRNPNSTDIERIKSVKGASIYVAKYIAKDSKYRKIEGRLWGCSDGLKNVLSYVDVADSGHWEVIQEVKKEPKVKEIKGEHYTVYIGEIRTIIRNAFPELDRKIKSHYIDTYKRLYQPDSLLDNSLRNNIVSNISSPGIVTQFRNATINNNITAIQLSMF